MASEGASGADQTDNDTSADQSSKTNRAQSELSDKSSAALSGERPQPSNEPNAADRAASQDRMQATGLTPEDVLGPGIESLPIMDDPGSLHTGHPLVAPVGEDSNLLRRVMVVSPHPSGHFLKMTKRGQSY